ncbi:MobF family relaxase [Luteipulveratus sp. YIM 133132]|uniref:MobF family relaxase n=1 Tax=Luteipulveratus flavus TaxID=3031728 RepID=UPI0023B14E79|nr:MobF family relaxase [Luteipulveratus sp. YIM 133132]MDE9364026.1 MobF family relaxase [Luteipulveratus sp. YIM 133132]
MMSLHKLTAGDGYEYLTRQVAASDSTKLGSQALADYYSEKGERPGVWMGRGLAGIDTLAEGETVTAEQMKNLFGRGRHPDAEGIIDRLGLAGESDEKTLLKAASLGAPFQDLKDEPSDFLVEVTREYNRYNTAHGLPRDTAVPHGERTRIRTEVGRRTYEKLHGRAPLDERELAGHIARESRPRRQQVAGYDLTFSPVKSVSVAWALAPREVGRAIERAHEQAIKDTLAWLEDEVIFSRRGKGGVRHVPVRGLLATAFTHRDSRTGDPDLHTHVAISNKVQDPTDGAWLAIDGQVLHKAAVAASERYNTLLEGYIAEQCGGWTFTERSAATAGKRVIRELDGVPQDLIDLFSGRRQEITAKVEDLQKDFRAAHGRPPTAKENIKLHQQANLATRERKHEPRSHAEQTADWTRRAEPVMAWPALQAALNDHRAQRRTVVTPEQMHDLAGTVIRTVEEGRARFQPPHITAEVARVVKTLNLTPEHAKQVSEDIAGLCLSPLHAVRLDAPDEVADPDALRRPTGESQFQTPQAQLYTTTRVLDAEDTVVRAAQRPGGRVVEPDVVEVALQACVAEGLKFNASQRQMVTELATTSRRAQLVLAPAGSGKTTSMKGLTKAWTDSGGTVIGLAPSAVAADELRKEITVHTDTLAKLVWHLNHPGNDPEWMSQVDADTLLIIDEAGMAATTDLASAIAFTESRGGRVCLIGDDQQLASVAAGGVLRAVAAEAGAVTLSELHRFTDPAEAANTLLLREGDTEALGFLLDNGRVRVTGQQEATGAVHTAWKSDLEQGKSALMLAFSNDTVNEMNAKARATLTAAGDVDDTTTVRLASSLPCGAGDVIITRQNDRRLRLSATDFVKNGDRWSVQQVGDDGSVLARHHGLGATMRLPAQYVAAHVDLGYATTFHGAQGQTVDSSYCLVTGTENRQLLYVGLSRGRSQNVVFVPSGGDGDEHKSIRPEHVSPQTAVEILEKVIRRDGAQVAARTEQQTQQDPRFLLHRAAGRYTEAVRFAAEHTVGAERMAELTQAADRLHPGLPEQPAWPTLAGHLAILDLSGADPIAELREAITARELDTALDVAAVLDWRLDSSGAHSANRGPLPWLPGIPEQLRASERFGDYLQARFNQTVSCKDDVHDLVAAMAPEDAPAWAAPLVDTPGLHGDVAVWRAVHAVPEEDTTPTGPTHPSLRERTHQLALVRRYQGVTIDPGDQATARFAALVTEHTPTLVRDPWWPVLAARLDLARSVDAPVEEHLAAALAAGPLPDEHAAAALWSRLSPQLTPAVGVTATSGSGAARLRPGWTPHLLALLPDEVGARVLADSQWPVLVASVNQACSSTGQDAKDILSAAIGLIGREHLPHPPGAGATETRDGRVPLAALATVIAWRVHDVTTGAHVDEHDLVGEDDLLDHEMQDYLRTARAAEHADTTPGQTAPEDQAARPVDEPPLVDDESLPIDPHDLEREPAADHTEGPTITRERVLELNRAAADWFAGQYEDSPAQGHLTGRFGVDPATHGYLCGYTGTSRTGLIDHLRQTQDATGEELLDAGLAMRKYQDPTVLEDVFRQRAMVAIRDVAGNVVGFSGRDLSGYAMAPKYKNSPTTPAFTKGQHLFGLYEALHAGEPGEAGERASVAGVTGEGPMDAIAITIAGHGTTFGLSAGGTSFTDAQADLVARYATRTTDNPTDRVTWLAFDHDDAGRRATRRAHEKLVARGITPRSIFFTGKDPGEAFEHDRDTFALMLNPDVRDRQPLSVCDLVDQALRACPDTAERLGAATTLTADIAALHPQHWDTAVEYLVDQTFPGQRESDPDYTALQTNRLTAAVINTAVDWEFITDWDLQGDAVAYDAVEPTPAQQQRADRLAGRYDVSRNARRVIADAAARRARHAGTNDSSPSTDGARDVSRNARKVIEDARRAEQDAARQHGTNGRPDEPRPEERQGPTR